MQSLAEMTSESEKSLGHRGHFIDEGKTFHLKTCLSSFDFLSKNQNNLGMERTEVCHKTAPELIVQVYSD